MADIDLQKEQDEDLEELELEDLDSDEELEEETGTEEDVNPVPAVQGKSMKERALEKYEGAKEKGSALVEKAKGKADNLFDRGMTAGRAFYEKNKGKAFSLYDKVMDFKDDIHDARKAAGGGWAGIKSAASVIGGRIKDTDTYKKFAGSRLGKGMSAVGSAISSGASKLKEKAVNTKLGQWIAKKKEEKEAKKDEPGFFSKAWGKIKSGASALKEKAANSKLGQWIAKKKEEKEEKKDEPGFFSKAWGKIKSGASALKEKAVNSKLGQWVAKKKAEKEEKRRLEGPGLLERGLNKIKTGATALKDKVMNSSAVKWASGELAKGKEWLNEQKQWLNEKKERLLEEKDRISDELDDHEFERRMNQKAKNGDPEYRKRYMDLLEELNNLPGIKELQGSLSRGEIDNFTKELESGKEEEKEESKVASAGNILQKTGKQLNDDDAKKTIAQMIPDEKIGDFASKNAPAILTGAGALFKAGGHAKQAYDANKKAKNIAAMGEKFSSDSVLQRSAAYASDESRKQAVTKGFDAVGDITSGAKKVLKYTGAGTKLASVANFGVSAAKQVVTSSMDKKSRKNGLKGILGGVEGYRKLKEKYRLQAPEMRRAIRESLGVRSEEDAVNTDKMVLSGQMANRMEGKDQSAMELAKTMGAKDRKGLYRSMGGSSNRIGRKQYAHSSRRMA